MTLYCDKSLDSVCIRPSNSVSCLYVLPYYIHPCLHMSSLISSVYCRVFKLTQRYMIYLIGVWGAWWVMFFLCLQLESLELTVTVRIGQCGFTDIKLKNSISDFNEVSELNTDETEDACNNFSVNIFNSFSPMFICYIVKWLWN